MHTISRRIIETVCVLSGLFLLFLSINPPCCAQNKPRLYTAAAELSDSLDIPASSIEQQAADLISQNKLAEARDLLQHALKDKQPDGAESNLRYMLALAEFNSGDFKSAASDLQTLLGATSTLASSDAQHVVLLQKRLGDCYFGLRNFSQSLAAYKAAQAAAQLSSAGYDLKVRLNEAILACLKAQNKYAEALPVARQMLADAKANAASGTLASQGDLLWAYIENLDVLRSLGKEKDAERIALRNEAAPLLVQLLTMRGEMDSAGQLPSIEEVRKAFVTDYVRENRPASLAEYLWLTLDFKMRSLPLIAWRANEQPKAAILCIHGLGLENRAFTPFGKAMAQKGYLVLAMDVRGFGSWQNTPGQDNVQFASTLRDIEGIVALVKDKQPGMPIFLVGESMGGGIALQAAAALDGTIAGVISSVPSPDRFQEGRASMGVAMHFLKGRNKAYDIGTMVTHKATSNPTLLHAWETDPKAKMDMSPLELMQFDKFMRSTAAQCKKITSTPVFIVQGTKDRLVKPAGSQDLFDAVANDDKSLLIEGNAEHLIFETEQPPPILLDSLNAWMSQHAAAAAK